MTTVRFELGLKSDPIEYRYSFPWLFELLAKQDVRRLQLGSFFEVYQLPDEFFKELREQADSFGIQIDSLFTAHRELGGFFRQEAGFEAIARKNFERFIEVGAILGATSVGSNPGAVLRDQMGTKDYGVRTYLKHMRELMHFAHERGVQWLTIEPMSCLAEPPTLPEEMDAMGVELLEYHRKHATTTAKVGYCVDVAHGYANRTQQIIHDHVALLDASVPYLYELHLKNTDALYNSTFGFSESERKRGIIDVAPLLRRLQTQAARLPVKVIGAYLEIGGPKTGRDYSDCHLEKALLDSMQFLKPIIEEVNRGGKPSSTASDSITSTNAPVASNATIKLATDKVQVAPSMMCADALNLQLAAEQMEQIGVSAFHIDIMDGHFAPNLSMALPQVEQLATRSKVPLDVHLMVENNDLFVELLGRMRIWQITVHAESSLHLDRTLAQIRKLGIRAGVALNPHTSVETLRYILPRVDTVLVMTVNPGFAGQQLVPSAIEKIRDVKRFLIARGSSASVAVDGNVSFENIPAMVAAGADYLVGGTSSLFAKQGQLADLVQRVNQTVAEGLQRRSQSA